MKTLYPLLFENNLFSLVWGGHQLEPLKGIPSTDTPIGESWEVSAVPGKESVVANGGLKGHTLREIAAEYGAELLGEYVAQAFDGEFPLLIKFIDAAADLSIQVHPNDAMAREQGKPFGKTEMWYVIDAKPGATLYSGLSQTLTPEALKAGMKDGSICEMLEKHEVKAGDVFFIPAGRIHAICSGILLAEVQQSSDTTYRLYDYNRMGLDGRPRELHVDLAAQATDYRVYPDYKTTYAPCKNAPVTVAECPLFTVRAIDADKAIHEELSGKRSFVIYMCLDGQCDITTSANESLTIKKGQTVLIPATQATVDLRPMPTTRLLEVYIDGE